MTTFQKEMNGVKKLLLSMYSTFPNDFKKRDEVESEVSNPFVLSHLAMQGYIIESEDTDNDGTKYAGYSLGIDALPLISAWKTEELTDQLRIYTIILLFLTGALFLVEVGRIFLGY